MSSATKRTYQKQHTHTQTHGETKEQGPPQLSRLSMRPLALGRRFESCRGRSMEHWQKDAARKSTSNIAAKGGSLPRQRPHKAQDSSRGFFAGGACQVKKTTLGSPLHHCVSQKRDTSSAASAACLFVCLFVCCSVCFCLCVCWVTFACCCIVEDVADGHTVPNAPDLCRPPRLRSTGPGQY